MADYDHPSSEGWSSSHSSPSSEELEPALDIQRDRIITLWKQLLECYHSPELPIEDLQVSEELASQKFFEDSLNVFLTWTCDVRLNSGNETVPRFGELDFVIEMVFDEIEHLMRYCLEEQNIQKKCGVNIF